jgi:hypothetical protein
MFLTLPVTILAHVGDEKPSANFGEYKVTLDFEGSAKAGENLLHVQIVNGTGAPVKGALVEVSAKQVEKMHYHQANAGSGNHAMGGMDGMSPSADPAKSMPGMHSMGSTPATVPAITIHGMGDDDYVGVITFASAGHWSLKTHVMFGDQMFMADLPVEVGVGGFPPATILALFIALNALIIGVAAKTKPPLVSAEHTVKPL